MGFETPEAAERFAEQAELAADRRKEERLLNGIHDPKEMAWTEIKKLESFPRLKDVEKRLLRQVFDFAWDRALRTS